MEYLFSFSPYYDDYEEGPAPEDDDGDGESVTPEDPDPEDDPPSSSRG